MFNDIFKRTKQYTIISKLKSYKKAKFILTSTFEKIEKPEPCRFASEYSKETETFKRVETLWVSPINPDSRKIYVSMVDNVEIYMKEFKELLNSVPQFISDNFKLTS